MSRYFYKLNYLVIISSVVLLNFAALAMEEPGMEANDMQKTVIQSEFENDEFITRPEQTQRIVEQQQEEEKQLAQVGEPKKREAFSYEYLYSWIPEALGIKQLQDELKRERIRKEFLGKRAEKIAKELRNEYLDNCTKLASYIEELTYNANDVDFKTEKVERKIVRLQEKLKKLKEKNQHLLYENQEIRSGTDQLRKRIHELKNNARTVPEQPSKQNVSGNSVVNNPENPEEPGKKSADNNKAQDNYVFAKNSNLRFTKTKAAIFSFTSSLFAFLLYKMLISNRKSEVE